MLSLPNAFYDPDIGVLAVAFLRRLEVSPRYYFLGLAILVVLLLFALVKAYGVWEEIHDVEEPDSPEDLLESFEEAYAAGELEDEEFERVRRRLSGEAVAGESSPSPPAVPEDHPPEGH